MTVMEAVIVSGSRTPLGKFLGGLHSFTAPQLGSLSIKETVRRSVLEPKDVDEVIMGNVITAGVGQNPARQAALGAGFPKTIDCFTVNKVCGSGMKAAALAAQAIKCGDAKTIVAGGMESMSNTPFLIWGMREGKKFGNSVLVDAMLYDGLTDAYKGEQMGCLADDLTKKFKISRREQDEFALESHTKASGATKGGLFNREIVSVKTEEGTVSKDECIRQTSMEKLSKLEPAFRGRGTMTAGNACSLSDGAASLLVTSSSYADEKGLRPMARILGYSSAHLKPEEFPIAPAEAMRKLLEKTSLSLGDFGLIEINEAFAGQVLAVHKLLPFDLKRLNVKGGAIALGHPIGCSGARILVTLIHALKKGQKGLASLCLGGGGAMAMAVEAI